MKKIKIQTLTLEQAKKLKPGTILYHIINRNSDGSAQRWKVNGKVKLWARDASRVQVSIKHGLKHYDYLTEDILHLVSLTNHTEYHNEVCMLVSQAKALQASKIKEGYSTHIVHHLGIGQPKRIVCYYKLIN